MYKTELYLATNSLWEALTYKNGKCSVCGSLRDRVMDSISSLVSESACASCAEKSVEGATMGDQSSLCLSAFSAVHSLVAEKGLRLI